MTAERMTGELSAFAGNQGTLATLRQAKTVGRLPHAYVFSGPPQIGKNTLARWLAALLLCQDPTSDPPEPCGVCGTCRRVANGTHPDVQTFSLARQAASTDRVAASRELGIDTVREIVREIDLLPFEANRKVYIVEDADALTDEAANGLLKTLEEPPSYAMIVLLATEDRRLPDTIRSRCTILRLHPVATTEIKSLLEARTNLPPETVTRIAHLSLGRPGWALQAAADSKMLVEHDAHVDALVSALTGGATVRLGLAEKMAKRWSDGHRPEIYATLYDWLGFWRYVVLHVTGIAPADLYPQHQSSIDRLAANGIDMPARAASRTVDAISHLDANVSARMAIETLLLDLP